MKVSLDLTDNQMGMEGIVMRLLRILAIGIMVCHMEQDGILSIKPARVIIWLANYVRF